MTDEACCRHYSLAVQNIHRAETDPRGAIAYLYAAQVALKIADDYRSEAHLALIDDVGQLIQQATSVMVNRHG